MIATLAGRLETKLLTYVIFSLVTAVFVWLKGPVYLWAFAVTVVVGLILETIWGVAVTYQPGWLRILFGIIEFSAVIGITVFFRVSMPFPSALLYYATAWSIIQLFLLYLLPVWKTSWGDDGGELW